MTEINPILVGGFRIPFDRIESKHVQPGVEQALADAQAEIDALAADSAPPTWDNTLATHLDATFLMSQITAKSWKVGDPEPQVTARRIE